MTENDLSSETIRALTAMSEKGDTDWICIINKTKDKDYYLINLPINEFVARQYKAVGFNATDNSEGPLRIVSLEVDNNSGNFKLGIRSFHLQG
ncbi:MAG: hypothetical protein ABI325_00250 [Ginsengibacter sp.]